MQKPDAGKSENPVWNLFKSVKLTIVILIILAIASIAGTLIPQQEGAIGFARKLSPGVLRIFDGMGLFDMYHALWFRLIIAVLALNLIICTIDRFPTAWKRLKAQPRPDRSKPFENLPPERTFTVKGSMTSVAERLKVFMKARYKNISDKREEKEYFLYGDKGRYSHMGVYIVHLSVLLILMGSIIGSFFGLEAFVNIAEGESVDTIRLRKSNNPYKIPFQVLCKKFTVDFYDNGAPKEFRSDLQFLVDGKVVKEGPLIVNHPITFQGITFYQSTYGKMPDRIQLKIARQGSGSETNEVVVSMRKAIPLPGKEGQFEVADIKDNFMRWGLGPAVLIRVHPSQGEEKAFWVFQQPEMVKKKLPGIFEKYPKLNPASYPPYVFFLEEFESKYYTGLQANRDPGVFLVWIACFLMVLGFFVAFFTSHRQFRVRIQSKKDRLKISIAGNTSKNEVGLERDLDQLTGQLRDHLADEG
ncbi:MAG: cytochrome c biogenesis protein ResB [Deltaproteobacteria bacterium]|nr:cytochrome c biogenesis protein ResB [Deltaproteobacteria bacterium]